MDLKTIFRLFNFLEFVNIHRYNLLEKFLYLKYTKKKKTILRNSYSSNLLIEKFFKTKLNYDLFRNIFFSNKLFAYSDLSKKDVLTNLIKEKCSDSIKKYLKYVEKILQKEFSVFEKKYRFDKSIDWRYSFLADYSWPFKKSEKINIRPKDIAMDVKYVWEFNRHQYMTYLGFAYYVTNDEKYAIEFKNQILNWIRKNPPLYGINWVSGLEISIRLTSWIFSLLFFKESNIINSNEFFEKIFKSMFQHAYYLRFFYKRRSFNHTVGDLFGIYLFSKIFEEIKPIKKWERYFSIKFRRQFKLQTRPDGTNVEQSVNYHRFVLEFFTLYLILNNASISGEDKILIEKMYDFLLHIIKPNGKLPLIGDNDDGKVILLTSLKKNPIIDLFNIGSIIFQREDLKYLSKKISITSLLLFGKKGYEIFDKLKSNEPKNTYYYFEKAGYTVIRNNWTEKANYLFVDYGKFGAHTAAHSHSDITNFIYCYRGKEIIIDSGNYTYNKSWNERNYFRRSEAHNILTVNNKNQAKISSWFEWEGLPKIKRKIYFNEDKIILTCFHNGYKGFIVKRQIETNAELSPVIIKDSIIKKKEFFQEQNYYLDIFFHFGENLNINIKNKKVIIDNELTLEVSSKYPFSLNSKKSFYAPNYGIKKENIMINIHLEPLFEMNDIIEIKTEIKILN